MQCHDINATCAVHILLAVPCDIKKVLLYEYFILLLDYEYFIYVFVHECLVYVLLLGCSIYVQLYVLHFSVLFIFLVWFTVDGLQPCNLMFQGHEFDSLNLCICGQGRKLCTHNVAWALVFMIFFIRFSDNTIKIVLKHKVQLMPYMRMLLNASLLLADRQEWCCSFRDGGIYNIGNLHVPWRFRNLPYEKAP